MESKRSSVMVMIRCIIMSTTATPLFFFSILSLSFLSLNFRSVEAAPAAAYKNYTVGDSMGWYDNLQKPTLNYQKWVAGKDFSLGDFLIFNTDSNHSVVQTYNFTTYKKCDYDNAEEDDTIQWSSADPSSTAPVPVTVAIPLIKEGMTYFFSGDYDGEQCKHGQHFKINVTYGKGLPASLKNPSTELSPPPTSSTSGDDDDDSTPDPDTVVSSNFNNPKESTGTSDVKETSGSVSLTKSGSALLDMKLMIAILVLVYIW